MSKLVLIRHADSMQHSSEGDIGRELTAAGHRQARMLGGQIRAALRQVDTVLVSPARRARQTLANLEVAGEPILVSEIYRAGAGEIWSQVTALSAGQVTLVVGHEPTISQLGRLAAPPAQTRGIAGGVGTGTAMIFECTEADRIANWNAQTAELVQMVRIAPLGACPARGVTALERE